MNNAADPPSKSAVRRARRAADRPCEILLENPCRYPEARARQLRPWLAHTVAEVAPASDVLAVRFVSDREMRRLNRTYRGHDKTTDVLSFPGELAADEIPGIDLAPEGGEHHLGDLVISVPRARHQAAERGHSVARELRVLLLHGLLHCLGYDHEADDGQMERFERRLRRRLIDHDPTLETHHA